MLLPQPGSDQPRPGGPVHTGACSWTLGREGPHQKKSSPDASTVFIGSFGRPLPRDGLATGTDQKVWLGRQGSHQQPKPHGNTTQHAERQIPAWITQVRGRRCTGKALPLTHPGSLAAPETRVRCHPICPPRFKPGIGHHQ